jgi:hypothetical protein
VGIYEGDHKFIHSPRPGYGVRVEDMRQAYWERRYNGARRVKDLGKNPLNALPNFLSLSNANAGSTNSNTLLPEQSNAPLSPATGFFNANINELGLGLFWDKSTSTSPSNVAINPPALNAPNLPSNNK